MHHSRSLAAIFCFTFLFALVAEPAHALVWSDIRYSSRPAVRHPQRKKVKESGTGRAESWRIRNDQRTRDLKLISNAFYNYRRENKDKNVPGVLLDKEMEICRFNARSCAGLLDVQEALKSYLTKMPVDPQATGNGTRYMIKKDWKGRVFLTAPDAEEGWSIRQMH